MRVELGALRSAWGDTAPNPLSSEAGWEQWRLNQALPLGKEETNDTAPAAPFPAPCPLGEVSFVIEAGLCQPPPRQLAEQTATSIFSKECDGG